MGTGGGVCKTCQAILIQRDYLSSGCQDTVRIQQGVHKQDNFIVLKGIYVGKKICMSVCQVPVIQCDRVGVANALDNQFTKPIVTVERVAQPDHQSPF